MEHKAAGGAASTAAAAGAQRQPGQTPPPGSSLTPDPPPYHGVSDYVLSNTLPWRCQVIEAGKVVLSVHCATRDEAAAAHDLGLIWKRVHGRESQKGSPPVFNFPQLLEDQGLKAHLLAAADRTALKAAIDEWLQHSWPQQQAALLAGRAAALDRCISGTAKQQGITRRGSTWKATICVSNELWHLGGYPSKEAAGVVWDAANVWRGIKQPGNTQASRTFNHPQLRLWEDQQLTAGLQRVPLLGGKQQLQDFLRSWARQHLPTKLAQLQGLTDLSPGGASAGQAHVTAAIATSPRSADTPGCVGAGSAAAGSAAAAAAETAAATSASSQPAAALCSELPAGSGQQPGSWHKRKWEEQDSVQPGTQAEHREGADDSKPWRQQQAQQQQAVEHQRQSDRKRERQQRDQLSITAQIGWQAPPVVDAVAAVCVAGRHIGPAAGTYSTEVAARKKARMVAELAARRASGRQLASQRAQQPYGQQQLQRGQAEELEEPAWAEAKQGQAEGQLAVLPYTPTALEEQQEQEAVLRQAGWQPAT